MADHSHVSNAHGPEQDVRSVKTEVLRHTHTWVIDVGRQIDKVVSICLFVDVLLQKLISGKVLSTDRSIDESARKKKGGK